MINNDEGIDISISKAIKDTVKNAYIKIKKLIKVKPYFKSIIDIDKKFYEKMNKEDLITLLIFNENKDFM